MKGRRVLLSIILLTSIMITTIVYSAFNTTLQIKGDAIIRSIQDIRITNVSVSNRTNGAYETFNNKYSKDTTSLYATLPASSSITYTVEITNKVNSSYLIDSITQQSHTNSNVNVDISLNVNDIVNGNSTKTFTITLTNNTQTEQEETLVYKYQFKLNSFTVTFDANGGQVSTPSKTVSYGSTYGSLPTPTRTGYTFKGWNGKNLFDEEEILMGMNGTTYDNEYYIFTAGAAHNKYSSGINQLDNFKSNTQYTLSYIGYSVPESNTQTNFRFVFKYTDDTEDLFFIDADRIYEEREHSFTSRINKTIKTIYMTYGFTGTIYMKNVQLEEGSTATTYEPYYVTSSTNVTQAKNHTLTAIWEPNTYTVTFDYNDGITSNTTQQVTYDQPYGTLPSVSRTGYTFNGWYYGELFPSNTYSAWADTFANNASIVNKLKPSTRYIVEFDFTLNEAIPNGYQASQTIQWGNFGFRTGTSSTGYGWVISNYGKTYTEIGGENYTVGQKYHITGAMTSPSDLSNAILVFYTARCENGNSGYVLNGSFSNVVLYEDTVPYGKVENNTIVNVASNHTLTAIWEQN